MATPIGPIVVINPRTGQPFNDRAANAALVRAAGERTLAQYQNIAIREIIASAAQATTGAVAEALTIFSQSLRSQYSKAREYELRNVHTKIALDAQRSMVNRYIKIVEPRSVGDYRSDETNPKWRRYGGGRMLKAISSPTFFRASKDGILWANISELDKQAPQWYRLNYGAGPRGRGYRASQAFPQTPMKFFGQTLATNLIPKNFNASPTYRLPKGVFGDVGFVAERFKKVDITSIRGGRRGGRRVFGSPLEFGPAGFDSKTGEKKANLKDRSGNLVNFYSEPFNPLSYLKAKIGDISGLPTIGPKPSRGFAGAFFIEAGLSRMSKTIPTAYEKLMTDWLREAASSETGPISKIINTKRANRLLSETIPELERLSRNPALVNFTR